ncbi:response regulator [Halomonas denitrificans]|nr:response regulator [Halomonas denitrificans]
MIKLLIVEDHHLVRLGLRGILDDAPGIEIIGEAESGEEALRLCRDLVPDVILMDISLPGLSGFETSCRILRQLPEVRILALTAHAQAPYPARLMDMGVAGFLTKACSANELVRAIRTVHCGERHIGNEVAAELAMALLPGAPRSPFQTLTPREMEVALMLAEGRRVNDIARLINVSPKTVATHKYRIYDKLGVDSEVALLREAIRHDLIDAAT